MAETTSPFASRGNQSHLQKDQHKRKLRSEKEEEEEEEEIEEEGDR